MTMKDSSLINKAEELLKECSIVTIASVNSDGFPRPVPIAKGDTCVKNMIISAHTMSFSKSSACATSKNYQTAVQI